MNQHKNFYRLSITFFKNRLNLLVFSLLGMAFINPLHAQDLEPRFLSSVPLKFNYGGIVYLYSTGDILLNSQTIENLNADLNTLVGYYGRSVKIFNKPSKIDVAVPYSFGYFNALVNNVDTTVTKNGFADPTLRVSMILIGEKALKLQDFIKREKKKFKLGTAIKIKFPFGRYNNTKLINLGANRWAFQFKVAASYSFYKKIILELHADSWFFTKNNTFFSENTLQQTPLLSTQFHVAYIFNPKFWLSGSIGQVFWGETSINGIDQKNNQKNSKFGITASYRLSKLGSLKASITNGLYTVSGNDFTTFLVGYSFLWFDKNKLSNKGS